MAKKKEDYSEEGVIVMDEVKVEVVDLPLPKKVQVIAINKKLQPAYVVMKNGDVLPLPSKGKTSVLNKEDILRVSDPLSVVLKVV